MSARDVVVIGASAGGLDALKRVAALLPADFPGAIFVVLHMSPDSPGLVPQILGAGARLPVLSPRHGEPIRAGRIYVAPPDMHLLVHPGRIAVIRGPRENRHRPAIDPLFRSAAAAYRERVVGVILTGMLDDGTAGLRTIKRLGGLSIVQDPADALYPDMPKSALRFAAVDEILPLSEIPARLVELAVSSVPASRRFDLPGPIGSELRAAEMDRPPSEEDANPGTPSAFSCPECHGTLWELQEGDLLRFRCRVGHAFSPEGMISEQDEDLERALWIALRALEEKAALARKLAAEAAGRNVPRVGEIYVRRREEAEENVRLLREMLLNDRRISETTGPPETRFSGGAARGRRRPAAKSSAGNRR